MGFHDSIFVSEINGRRHSVSIIITVSFSAIHMSSVLSIPLAFAEDEFLDQTDCELETTSDLVKVCNAPLDDPLVEKPFNFTLGSSLAPKRR